MAHPSIGASGTLGGGHGIGHQRSTLSECIEYTGSYLVRMKGTLQMSACSCSHSSERVAPPAMAMLSGRYPRASIVSRMSRVPKATDSMRALSSVGERREGRGDGLSADVGWRGEPIEERNWGPHNSASASLFTERVNMERLNTQIMTCVHWHRS